MFRNVSLIIFLPSLYGQVFKNVFTNTNIVYDEVATKSKLSAYWVSYIFYFINVCTAIVTIRNGGIFKNKIKITLPTKENVTECQLVDMVFALCVSSCRPGWSISRTAGDRCPTNTISRNTFYNSVTLRKIVGFSRN